MRTAELAEIIHGRLASLGAPARAEQEKRYLKSDLTFLGVTVPLLRSEAKAFVRQQRALRPSELRALVDLLWCSGVHELRSFGIALLELRVKELVAQDAAWMIPHVREARSWAHVDWIATKVLGPLVAGFPALAKDVDRWAGDEDFWIRRTALLVFHDPLLAGEGDFDHFARIAAPMLGEREFFIRKAIGWVLRSTAKRTPARTIAFVQRHAGQMSGLTFKEATRNLPASEQKRLRALRGET